MPDNVANLTPLSLEAWPPQLSSIISDMKGAPLNVHRLIAHNPDLLKAWWGNRQHLVTGGALGSRLAELAILRVGVRVGSWYEWAAHFVRGQQAGLTKTEIYRVVDGGCALGWTESDAVILDVIDDLFDQHKVNVDTLKRFSKYYDNKQLLDLIALHGMYVFLGGILNTWNPPLEDTVLAQLSESETVEELALRCSKSTINSTLSIDEAIALSRSRLRGLVRGDWDAISNLVHPDLHYIHASGETQDQQTYLSYLRQNVNYISAESDIESTQIYTDSFTLVGTLKLHLKRLDGSEYRGLSRFTEIWRMDGGRWKLVVFQSTLIKS